MVVVGERHHPDIAGNADALAARLGVAELHRLAVLEEPGAGRCVRGVLAPVVGHWRAAALANRRDSPRPRCPSSAARRHSVRARSRTRRRRACRPREESATPAAAARGSAALTIRGAACRLQSWDGLVQPQNASGSENEQVTQAHGGRATRSRLPRQCWRSPRVSADPRVLARYGERCPVLRRPSRE